MRNVLTKADSKVETDALRCDALGTQARSHARELLLDIEDDIIVDRGLLHGLGRTTHMHDHEPYVASCRRARASRGS